MDPASFWRGNKAEWIKGTCNVPLIPGLRTQRQVDLCEFIASLVYSASSRIGSRVTAKPCLRKKQQKKKIKKSK